MCIKSEQDKDLHRRAAYAIATLTANLRDDFHDAGEIQDIYEAIDLLGQLLRNK